VVKTATPAAIGVITIPPIRAMRLIIQEPALMLQPRHRAISAVDFSVILASVPGYSTKSPCNSTGMQI
jgi:hypothetical protein